MGAMGATSTTDTTLIRMPFGNTPETITNSTADNHYTLLALRITDISYTLHDAPTGGNTLSGGTTNASPASRPQRIVWTVTYNIDPNTGQASRGTQDIYDIECTIACTAITPTITKSGSTHIITATAPPNPSNGDVNMATLVLGSDALNDAKLPITGMSGTVVHYQRDLEATITSVAKTTTQIFYTIDFNESVTGLTANELTLREGGSDVTTPPVVLGGSGTSWTATVTLPTPNPPTDNLSLRLLDDIASDRIRVTGNENRIAYTNGGGYDKSSAQTNFAAIPDGATAPTLTVTRSNVDGTTSPSAAIDGDQGDNNTATTYYWKLQFDQDISAGLDIHDCRH